MILIQDNGCGISQKKISKTKSFGMMGVRERTQTLAGGINIHSRAGVGATVSIKLPLNDKKC